MITKCYKTFIKYPEKSGKYLIYRNVFIYGDMGIYLYTVAEYVYLSYLKCPCGAPPKAAGYIKEYQYPLYNYKQYIAMNLEKYLFVRNKISGKNF